MSKATVPSEVESAGAISPFSDAAGASTTPFGGVDAVGGGDVASDDMVNCGD